jgi:hypothetical protein
VCYWKDGGETALRDVQARLLRVGLWVSFSHAQGRKMRLDWTVPEIINAERVVTGDRYFEHGGSDEDVA